MYIIDKPKEVTKVIKLNADEIFLADDTYYIKSVDSFYSMNKEMLKKLSFGDRSGLCIKAYRELEDMQLLTMQGITNIKGFKIIVVEEVRDIKEELTELIEDKPVEPVKTEPVNKRIFTQEEIEYLYIMGEYEAVKKIVEETNIELDLEAFKKEVGDMKEFYKMFGQYAEDPKKPTAKQFCTNCCGTCLDCPYLFNDDGIITDEYFLRWC